jgi:hypothetical protein
MGGGVDCGVRVETLVLAMETENGRMKMVCEYEMFTCERGRERKASAKLIERW